MEKTYELEAKEGFKFCYDCGHDNVSPAKLNDWINKYNLHFLARNMFFYYLVRNHP